MLKKKLFALFALLILVPSCTKLPIPQENTVNYYPRVLRDGTPILKTGPDLSYMKWWQKVNDPTLNQLMRDALKKNNQLKSSWQNILQAQAELKASYASWIPTISFNPKGFAARTWNNDFTSLNPLTSSFTNLRKVKLQGYIAGFVPSYTFNIMQNVENTKMAKSTLQLSMAEMQYQKLSIISQVIGAYFMLSNQKEQLYAERQYINDQKQLKRLEYVRFKSGANNIENVTSMTQTIAETQENIPNLQASIQKNENAIHILLDENPGSINNVHHIEFRYLKHIIPSHLSIKVLKNRPDLMMALNQVQIASAQFGVSESAFFPSISLTNYIGGASFELVNLLKASPNLWLGALSGAMNLLNVSSYYQIESSKAQFYNAYYSYINTLRTVLADVNNNLTQYHESFKVYELTVKALAAARQNYRVANDQYRAGAVDNRTVLNAKIKAEAANLNSLKQKSVVLDNLVNLYQALGGGYNLKIL